MKYALLIYEKADYRDTVSQERMAEVLREHDVFWNKYGEEKFRGAAGLEGHKTATTLRRSGDDYIVHDGPYAETREILGGFYVVECEDLDEAMKIARDIPLEEDEAVEIRPVMSE
ncbi:MAG: YciI family protein [Spirochaetales bacterium]